MRQLSAIILCLALAGCASSFAYLGKKESISAELYHDKLTDAWPAFMQSCKKAKEPEWKAVCEEARYVNPSSSRAIFTYFRQYFYPELVSDDALFTGYYVPLLRASKYRSGAYQYPIYALPYRDEDRSLTRKQIDDGALEGKAEVLFYADDPVALFFMHVQGSGHAVLPGGERMTVSFAAKNTCPYSSIGKHMIDQGMLQKEEVTAQSIKAWLRENPEQRDDILQQNCSYIFFRLRESEDVIGAQGVPLRSFRSIAVDPSEVPYGSPVWVETVMPNGKALKQLFIAQDTGSAITGADRADIFFGAGEKAGFVAGQMKQRGRWWALLPRE